MGNMIIVGPNGKRFKVNAPAGTSVQEIEETFARENGGARGTVLPDEAETAKIADLKRQYDSFRSTPEYQARQMGLGGGGIADYISNPNNPPLISSVDTRPKRVVPENPDPIGYGRKVGDLATGLYTGGLGALSSLVGLGTYVKGLNKIADPAAEFISGAAEYYDEKLLSDFQLSKDRELAANIQASVKDMPPLPENASTPEKIKYVADYIVSQGGAAGSFIKDNPGQVANLLVQTVPYIFAGGAIGKGTSAGLNLLDNAVSVGSKAKSITAKAAEVSGKYAGAIGEGLVAAGDVGAGTAISQRAKGNYDYDSQRLYGLLTAPVTAVVGAVGGRVAGVADADTLAARAFGAGTEATDLVQRGLVKRVTTGAATEGAEELVQGGSEQVFSNLANDEAAYEGVGSSAVLGLATGAALGAGVNVLKPKSESSATEVNEILEAAKDNVGEQLQLDLDDPSTPEQIQAAQEQAQQRAEVEAQQAKIAQDADNQVLRSEAQTFSRDDFKKQRTALLEQAVDNTETDLGKEFLEVINTPTEENPRGLIDVKDIKAARTSFVKAKAAEQEGTLNVEYEAELVNRVAKKAAVSNQGELDFKQATAVEKVQAELDKPALSGTKAIEQTERMFGKDWVNSGKYDDLAAVVNAPNFNRKKYAEALDKAVNPPAPTPVNTLAEDVADAAATLTAPEGLSEDQAKIFKVIADRFTGNKQNDIDTVYAGGEFLATKIAELAGVGQDAKDKGKSNVSKTIERLMTKVVENQGTVKRNSPKSEKQAAVKQLAAALATRAKEQRQEQIKASRPVENPQMETGELSDMADMADQNPSSDVNLGDVTDDGDNANTSIFAEQGMNTIASVGQGANTGVSEEDQAFSDNQTTSDEEVAAVAEAQNAETRVADEAELTRLEPLTKQLWGNQTETDYDTLSVDQKIMWMRSAMEYAFTKDVDTINNDLNQVLEMDGQDQSGATNETSEPSDAGRNAQTEKRVPQKSTSSVSETESSGGNTDSPARKTDTASGTQETQQVGFEQVTPEEVKAKRPELTDEQAKNIAGVTNGARASMAEADRNRQENSPEDNEQFEPVVVEKKPAKKKLAKKAKFGIPLAPEQRSTRAAFEQEIKNLTGRTTNSRIHVFETEAEALQAIEDGAVPNMDIERLKKAKPYGWVALDDNGDPHSHFILDRVSAGREKSAFLHELGGHVGIDGIIPVGDQQDLVTQILDWSEQDGNALESQIARRAIGRVSAARVLDSEAMQSDAVILSETIAYFLEEAALAGVDPSVNSTVANFVAKLRDFFRAAYEKLGFGEAKTLTTQDIVDLAYGAARVELMHGVSEANVQNPMVTTSMNAARMGIFNREFVRDQLGGEKAVQVFDTVVEVQRQAANSLKFVHNIVRENRESMPALGRWNDAMLKAEATRTEIKRSFQDVVKAAKSLAPERRALINKFLGESTFDQQWGYDPVQFNPELFAGKKVEINTGKQLQFNRLSDDEKKIVTDVFAHGERIRQRKVALAKKLGVAGKFFTDASLEGPYAPLKRFGNFAAELKSARLVEAERAATSEGATKKQKEVYEKLKSDSDHYVISFFDTIGSAKQFVDQNKKAYAFSAATKRAPNIESDRVSNPEVYEKVMAALAASTDSSMDGGAKTAFREMVRGMYFQSMDERSARTSGAKRLNRAGYEQDMLRSFENQAITEASLLSQMENGTEINTAFAEAGKQTRTATGEVRDPDKQRAFNSIASHYQNMLKQNDTPIQDRISTANSVYMLLTSIGYHVTNATQPIMVTIPRIAGDFGNYASTWSALFRGYKYSMAASKLGLNLEIEINLENVPQEYRGLLKTMQDRNLLDQGMEEDGAFNRFNTGFERLNQVSDVVGTLTSKLYNVAKFVESQNRIAAAVAAYDLARANPSKMRAMKMTPEQYATSVVEDTQGDFSQLDAPLLIKSLPKVMTQYRKYQLLMAWHYSNAAKQALAGETPEMKIAGGRILAYSLTHAAIAGGITGVPLVSLAFHAAMFISNALGDDEENEPKDLERWIKENIDDGAFGTALSRGAFSTFGLDLSTKLSQDKIFAPLAYADIKPGEDGAKEIIAAIAGPAASTGINFFKSAEYAMQGDVLKAIEYGMPKGIRSVAESYRLATEGMTTRAGTVVVDPREFDLSSLLINAMGLPSTQVNQLKWTKGQQYELEQYFSKEGSKIRKQYIEATRSRDRDAQSDLRKEFKELQKAKSRVRPFFNNVPGVLQPQSLMTLLKAPLQRRKLELKEQRKLSP